MEQSITIAAGILIAAVVLFLLRWGFTVFLEGSAEENAGRAIYGGALFAAGLAVLALIIFAPDTVAELLG